MKSAKAKTTEEFDRRFDAGEDITKMADYEVVESGAPKRVNIDLPEEFLAKLDKEAAVRGITRQSLIKVWLYEKLTAK
jgi:hypothetical protein